MFAEVRRQDITLALAKAAICLGNLSKPAANGKVWERGTAGPAAAAGPGQVGGGADPERLPRRAGGRG